MEEKTKDVGDLEVYEIGYNLLPTVLEEDIHSEVSKIHDLISKNDGVIVSEGAPQLRQLAYEMIKKVDTKNLKFNKAYFGWIKLEVEKSKIAKIKEKIGVMPNILRYIIIKTVKESTISIPKIHIYKKSEELEVEPRVEEKVEIDEKEIDKSIDELVVEDKI